MTEERLHALRADLDGLREDVVVLREYRAADNVKQIQLDGDVLTLTKAVKDLEATINQSRGALYVISAASGAVGMAAGGIATWLFHK